MGFFRDSEASERKIITVTDPQFKSKVYAAEIRRNSGQSNIQDFMPSKSDVFNCVKCGCS